VPDRRRVSASVCSVVLNERDLLRIGVLVIVLALLAWLVAARTRLVVEAERNWNRCGCPPARRHRQADRAHLPSHAGRRLC